jgi:outer membrane immunogenic protein
MRRDLLASTALTTATALVSGAACAAEIPFSWTGCYIGGNAGGAWTRIDDSVTTAYPYHIATFQSSGRDTGFTGGGQLGCNWQVDPSWVVGLEGDINYIHASRTQHSNPFSAGEDTVRTTSLRWLATVLGRFGYAWGPSLLYATGGLALGGVKASITLTDDASTVFAGSESATRAGWAAGAGYEYGFNDRLSLKLEYLHFDLGKVHYSIPRVDQYAACCMPWTASANVAGDIVRLGINYKFTQ